jgi:hypothetical protein
VTRSREFSRHCARLRNERPVGCCQWCDGLGLDPFGMPGEPCPDCQGRLRPWVRRALRLAWIVTLAILALASFTTWKGW